MKLFHNTQFIIHSDFPYWSKLGFKFKSNDGRVIDIKPLHITQPREERKQTILMNAEIKLMERPEVTPEKEIKIPKQEQEELNIALKIYSNLIAVANNCEVGLSGPTPSEGFIYETEEEKEFLDNTKGFDSTLVAGIQFSGNFFGEIYDDQLLDRIEGVAFLATANAQTDNVARFHEYIRLFERAFAAQTSQLARLLHQFISYSETLDYQLDELRDWMVNTRHGATHADLRDNFVFSPDLTKDIERIKQLAYLVLFNKKVWHDQSTERRELLKLKLGVTPGGMFMVQRKPGDERKFRISDDDEVFYAFEISEEELNAKEFKDLENWWVRWLPPNNYGKN